MYDIYDIMEIQGDLGKMSTYCDTVGVNLSFLILLAYIYLYNVERLG